MDRAIIGKYIAEELCEYYPCIGLKAHQITCPSKSCVINSKLDVILSLIDRIIAAELNAGDLPSEDRQRILTQHIAQLKEKGDKEGTPNGTAQYTEGLNEPRQGRNTM